MSSLGLAVVVACAGPDPGSPPDTGSGESTGLTGLTGLTGDTAPDDTAPAFDCSALPPAPLSTRQIPGARGYHDLAFDQAGHVIGSDGTALLAVTYDGDPAVFVPAAGTVQGIDWLPSGDLVYAEDLGDLRRAPATGGPAWTWVGTTGARLYGVRTDPLGRVYVATWDTIERHDPKTGEHVTILDDPAIRPYVLDFSPDLSTMYVGTIWMGGLVWALDLDADLRPVGDPRVLATVGTGKQRLHDALAVDWCGNVYVAEFYTNDLWRIRSDGQASLLWDFDETSYGHGIEWGSGIGGWRSDAIYVPQPYDGNQVLELVVGVPSRSWSPGGP